MSVIERGELVRFSDRGPPARDFVVACAAAISAVGRSTRTCRQRIILESLGEAQARFLHMGIARALFHQSILRPDVS
jgi:hypothetical protein